MPRLREPRSGPIWNFGCCARVSPSADPHLMHRPWSGRRWPWPERHGFVQTVVDTAPQLVEHVITESHLYSRSMQLTALINAGVKARRRVASASRPGTSVDPLTAAETRALEKLAEGLTYTQIASELYLSLNTVKTHLRHAYMKLGATSRSSAVKRAASLGILCIRLPFVPVTRRTTMQACPLTRDGRRTWHPHAAPASADHC